jgi:hypothetical protein
LISPTLYVAPRPRLSLTRSAPASPKSKLPRAFINKHVPPLPPINPLPSSPVSSPTHSLHSLFPRDITGDFRRGRLAAFVSPILIDPISSSTRRRSRNSYLIPIAIASRPDHSIPHSPCLSSSKRRPSAPSRAASPKTSRTASVSD